MHGYDSQRMGLEHPLDEALRARLRVPGISQVALAKAIGRNQPWLNKYMNGSGKATIDDVVRIVAVLIGIEVMPLSEMERRLLTAFRKIDAESHEDAIQVLVNASKGFPRGQSQQSSLPAGRTTPARAHKARGKRQAEG